MRVVPAYAKVNLALEVVRRRSDGWHDISSVVVVIDWHDLVGLSARDAGSTHDGVAALRVTGPEAAGVPAGEDNLALRALREIGRHVEGGLPAQLWLDKRIPAQAGLGGGSADAAATLRALSHAFAAEGQPVVQAALQVAWHLGSDVPALLLGGPALIRGRGDDTTRLAHLDLHLVVVLAGRSSTREVYAATTPAEMGEQGRAQRVAAALSSGLPPQDGDLGSALEAAACRVSPELERGLEKLRAAIPDRRWHMTGSGGAAFTIAASAVEAVRLAGVARTAGFVARPCRTVPPPAGATG